MPPVVREAIQGAGETVGGISKSEAAEYVAAMERDGRLFEECSS